jgi:hypothetical protein
MQNWNFQRKNIYLKLFKDLMIKNVRSLLQEQRVPSCKIQNLLDIKG